MDILYLLVPLSVVLVFVIVGALAWSVYSGQFDELERHGLRILDAEDGDANSPGPRAADVAPVIPGVPDAPTEGASATGNPPPSDPQGARTDRT
jgi:cbb3-type cytochrome oxidase maturation protein